MRFANRLLALAAALLVAGCGTGAAGIECHGTSWYRLGLQDGMLGALGEAERYAASCYNDFNRTQYQEGFNDGLSRRRKL
jgi:hypothetical protein